MNQDQFKLWLKKIENNEIGNTQRSWSPVELDGFQTNQLFSQLQNNTSVKNVSIKMVTCVSSRRKPLNMDVLSDALKYNKTITSLVISGGVEDYNPSEILTCLKNNNTITYFNFGTGVGAPYNLHAHTVSVLLVNNTLINIHLKESSGYDKEAKQKCEELLVENIKYPKKALIRAMAHTIVTKFVKKEDISLDKVLSNYTKIDKDQLKNKLAEISPQHKFSFFENYILQLMPEYIDSINTDTIVNNVSYDITTNKILTLIKEGNERINGGEEEAILVMGRTGSGKSTLTNLLVGKKLEAVWNDDLGKILIEIQGEGADDIKISYKKKSETTIPNKCIGNDAVNNTVVWDCPGFNDTDTAQEVANAFYVKKLFDQHKKLKFILVASEASITSDRGSSFVETIQQFCKSFGNVDNIKGSLRLVVTGAHFKKQPKHIQNELESILQENESLSPEVSGVIKYLSDNYITMFNAPKDEGDVKSAGDILKSIYRSTNFIDTSKEQGSISLSKEAQKYCLDLSLQSADILNNIVNIIVKSCCDPLSVTDLTQQSIFDEVLDVYKDFIPNNVENSKFVSIDFYSDRDVFREAKQLKDQIKILSNIDKISNYAEGIEFFINLLKGFAKYTPRRIPHTQENKDMLAKYAYLLEQQFNYAKLFDKLVDKEMDFEKEKSEVLLNNDSSDSEKSDLEVEDDIFLGLRKTTENSTTSSQEPSQKFVKLELDDIKLKLHSCKYALEGVYQKNFTNEDYFKQQITDDADNKTLFYAYKNIGNLNKHNQDIALSNYLKALEYKLDASVCNEVGDIMHKKGLYSDAVKFYYSSQNTIKLKQSFEKWIDEESDNHAIREQRGDIHFKLGNFIKAIEYFNNAKSLNLEEDYIVSIRTKIAECKKLEIQQQFLDDYVTNTENEQYFDFSLINLGEYTSYCIDT